MLFSEAVKELEQGHYMARTSWNDGSYVALLPGMQYIWKVMCVPNPAAGNWLPLMDDLLGEDWERLENIQTMKAANAPVSCEPVQVNCT